MSETGVKILHRTPFGVLSYQPTLRRVTMLRSAEPLPLDSFEALVGELIAAVEGIELRETHLLFDVRAVMGRNDDAFESASLALRRRFVVLFGRVAVLVRTLAGRLQGQRFAREDQAGAYMMVTSDMAEAEAFLAEPSAEAGS